MKPLRPGAPHTTAPEHRVGLTATRHHPNRRPQPTPPCRPPDLIGSGTRFRLLFLDPGSDAMKVREREEGYDIGFLAGLTEINLRIAQDRVRSLLEADKRDRVEIGVSNETRRFNITLIDDTTGVIQPYLPQARRVDYPTFLAEQIFASLWDRATLL